MKPNAPLARIHVQLPTEAGMMAFPRWEGVLVHLDPIRGTRATVRLAVHSSEMGFLRDGIDATRRHHCRQLRE
jgi:hypothetical protein